MKIKVDDIPAEDLHHWKERAEQEIRKIQFERLQKNRERDIRDRIREAFGEYVDE